MLHASVKIAIAARAPLHHVPLCARTDTTTHLAAERSKPHLRGERAVLPLAALATAVRTAARHFYGEQGARRHPAHRRAPAAGLAAPQAAAVSRAVLRGALRGGQGGTRAIWGESGAAPTLREAASEAIRRHTAVFSFEGTDDISSLLRATPPGVSYLEWWTCTWTWNEFFGRRIVH